MLGALVRFLWFAVLLLLDFVGGFQDTACVVVVLKHHRGRTRTLQLLILLGQQSLLLLPRLYGYPQRQEIGSPFNFCLLIIKFLLIIGLVIKFSSVLNLAQENVFLGHALDNGGSRQPNHKLSEAGVLMEDKERGLTHELENLGFVS